MAAPHVTLAKSTVRVGADFEADFIVDPGPDEAASDVVTALTGATIAASIVDCDEDLTEIVAAASVTASVVAATRTITLVIADTVTAELTPGTYRWLVTATTTGSKAWPVRGFGSVNVCAL